MNDASPEVVILGAGGHAKVLIDLLRRLGTPDRLAVLDRDRARIGQDLLGVPIIGDDGMMETLDRERVVLVNGMGSTRDTAARESLFMKGQGLGFHFRTLVHPTASVASDVVLGEGVQLLAGAIVNTCARIDDDAIVNTGAIVEHDCRVGAHAHVASGAVLAGGVTLHDGVHVGAGATVIQGISVGHRAVVGAGAVVVRDVEGGITVVGVPARRRTEQ
jgi:sugar O-acyltransferase (sialic acid O-acetyltransferase NeuD family)